MIQCTEYIYIKPKSIINTSEIEYQVHYIKAKHIDKKHNIEFLPVRKGNYVTFFINILCWIANLGSSVGVAKLENNATTVPITATSTVPAALSNSSRAQGWNPKIKIKINLQ